MRASGVAGTGAILTTNSRVAQHRSAKPARPPFLAMISRPQIYPRGHLTSRHSAAPPAPRQARSASRSLFGVSSNGLLERTAPDGVKWFLSV